jgi:branched-chain amino acid transport system substrate-binding protein
MKKPHLWVATLGAMAALAALGATSASTAPSASLAPIVIGNVSDQSGPVASSGIGWLPGLKAWVAWTNAHGGILGRKVQLISRDAKGDPATYRAVTKELLGKQLAAFIPASTLQFSPVRALVEAKKIPAIGGYQADPAFIQSPYSFPQMTTVDQTTYNLAKTAVLAGKKAGMLFYCAESPVCAQLIPLWQAGAKAAGSNWAGEINVAASTPDYTAQCLAAQQKGADWIGLGLAVAVVPRIAADCAKNNYRPLWILTAFDSSFLTQAALDGARYPFPTALYTSAAAATFRKAMATHQKSFVSNPAYGTWTYAAWVTGEVLKRAITLAKPTGQTVTPADVLRGLYLFKNETLGGQTPPLTYKKGAGHSVSCFFMGEVKNGKLRQIGKSRIC